MRLKLGISLALAFLAFVFITQNTDTVQVEFLFWSIEMSLVLLVFIMLGAGLIIGWLLSSYLRFAGNRQAERTQLKAKAPTGSGDVRQASKERGDGTEP